MSYSIWLKGKLLSIIKEMEKESAHESQRSDC